MKAQRPYPTITITPKGERALLGGHPWVYDAEITAQSGPIADGAIADVLSAKGRWLGSAFYNSHSKIRGRLISRNANDTFNEAFWRRRLQYAWDYRKSVLSPEDLSCCRVIFGEADAFPGLTVDRFNDILVVQILSLGMEQRKARPGGSSARRRADHSRRVRTQRRGPAGKRRTSRRKGLVPPAG